MATQKAEQAASKAGSGTVSGLSAGLAYLQPLLQEARQQLERDRAADCLQKAISANKSLPDLPKLEAAILAARKVKDVDPAILK